jgi:diguanylate cyclase (GGDEF)-like protein/PAS domain S-box-containing protein
MIPAWHTLVANLSVIAVTLAVWAAVQNRLRNQPSPVKRFVFGLIMGLGAYGSMVIAIQIYTGAFIDLRTTMLVIAGYFGGPVAAGTATVLAAAYRIYLGGSGLPVGLGSIIIAALIGVIGFWLRRGRQPTPIGVVLLGLCVTAATLSSVALLPSGPDILAHIGLPIGLLSLASTVGAGILIIQAGKLSNERDLLRAALTQAPDYHYVKDRQSRFAEVNRTTATYHGFADPSDMVGKTDFDLVDRERAATLFDAEQEVMRSGRPQLDWIERVISKDGVEQWFSTSKVPLRNRDGEVIGLAGVTRDITERRRFEAELRDSRNLLSYVVDEMSDGLAMFDREGFLVYCNDRYRELFPLTRDVRRPGVHIRDILRAVAETGEQLDIGDPAPWIDSVVQSMTSEGEQQVPLYDGRWVQIRNRATAGGASMVVVSDVTAIKKSEGELRELTDKLRSMATTDALTGLMNRRAFDATLAEELERTARAHAPFSLVLIDVDRFKAYNDGYGHQAGDEALKEVARRLTSALLRPRDVAARYGGEEFAVILPDTDEASAYIVAERIRQSLADAGMPHVMSEHGFVTLSIGIATYDGAELKRSVAQLIGRADEALYLAKDGGRNRAVSWQKHSNGVASKVSHAR